MQVLSNPVTFTYFSPLLIISSRYRTIRITRSIGRGGWLVGRAREWEWEWAKGRARSKDWSRARARFSRQRTFFN
ncbi:hypothetical protein Hanom_Chr12g01082511 [Helianthus anomalus]